LEFACGFLRLVSYDSIYASKRCFVCLLGLSVRDAGRSVTPTTTRSSRYSNYDAQQYSWESDSESGGWKDGLVFLDSVNDFSDPDPRVMPAGITFANRELRDAHQGAVELHVLAEIAEQESVAQRAK
jgi:hypothetical protein